ncbi:MAG: phosphate starvation-inducible protein PhoH [Ruminococcaceae bacterium]|nr:phosphate starvation-inducible protein PhoH [Oscillospiraceae bacterium]
MAEKIIATDSLDQTTRIYGAYDRNIRLVEDAFSVRVKNRDSLSAGGSHLVISGEGDLSGAVKTIEYLKKLSRLEDEITEDTVSYVINMMHGGKGDELKELDDDCICVTAKGKPIKAKTVGQKRYIEQIKKNTIVLGVGPAGTGKTYLAVAMAVTALRNKQCSRIILTRPAVEAGEKLGYLPGDLQNKIDPYLRPLHDALHEMLGAESCARYTEKGIIEIAPLAYMRGRTLDDSFIILDEAQNTTPEQMKMFLTRLGFNSKAIVTGDITQTDLPRGQKSGLSEAVRVLEDIHDIGIQYLTERDVVRHKLVQRIIEAYDRYDKEKSSKKYQFKKGKDQ